VRQNDSIQWQQCRECHSTADSIAECSCKSESWETPVQGGRLKSPHVLEIAFVFDNTERSARVTGGGARPAALADKMSDAWPKLPAWSPYTVQQRAAMVFNDQSAIVEDPLGARRAAMQALLGLT